MTTMEGMLNDGYACRAYPEYIVEMRKTGKRRYVYAIYEDGLLADAGSYTPPSGETGILHTEDPYLEVQKMNTANLS